MVRETGTCAPAIGSGVRKSGVRKAVAADLAVGLICFDRDGNRVRVDSVDQAAGKLSYHFLNDELRVQEGVVELPIEEFLSQSWRMYASGRL